MDEIQRLINLLNKNEYTELLRNMYKKAKEMLKPKWQDIDDEIMLSYLKAYCVSMCLDIPEERQRGIFVVSIELGYAFVVVCSSFIDQLNTSEAKMSELVNAEVLDDFKDLSRYINHPIYKELSKSNKAIARIIKEYHKYLTIEEIKNGKYLHSECNPTGYKLTGNEIQMIDRANKFKNLNSLAHMLYDEKGIVKYNCDYNIHNEKEVLKKFLMPTNACNPEYDIIFEDGTIVNYFMGDIRIKPYKFQDVLTYTKLFYASHFNEMKDFFRVKDNKISADVATKMIKSSYVNISQMFYALEDVYTQKMIDNSKEEIVKMKRIVKEYNL